MHKYRKQRLQSNIPGSIILPLAVIGLMYLIINLGFDPEYILFYASSYIFLVLITLLLCFFWFGCWYELYMDLFKYDKKALFKDESAERFEAKWEQKYKSK